MDLRKTQAISITESNIKKHIDAFNDVIRISKEKEIALKKMTLTNNQDDVDLHPGYIDDEMIETFINSYEKNINKRIRTEIEKLRDVLNSPG